VLFFRPDFSVSTDTTDRQGERAMSLAAEETET